MTCAARNLLLEESAESYQEKWVRYPFPLEDLTVLEHWVSLK